MIDTAVSIASYIFLVLALITTIMETLGYFVVVLPAIIVGKDTEEGRASIIPLILFIGAAVTRYFAS